MDILSRTDTLCGAAQLFQVCRAPYFPQRIRIGRLHADFQLHRSRTHPCQKFQFLLPQQICGNFKMEIGDTVVMFQNIFPDLLRMCMVPVKGSVYEFYLRYLCIQKKLQFFLYQSPVPQPHLFLQGRKTIAAAKRTSPAGLIIKNPVPERCQIPIEKRQSANVRRFPPSCRDNFPRIRIPENQTGNIRKTPFSIPPVKLQKPVKGFLAFPYHNTRQIRMLFQERLRVIGNFRPSQPNRHFRSHLRQHGSQCPHLLPVPNITGKRRHIRPAAVNIRQNIRNRLVDSILCQLHFLRHASVLRHSVGTETVDGRIGMNIFGIQRYQ